MKQVIPLKESSTDSESIEQAWKGISLVKDDQIRENSKKVDSSIDKVSGLQPQIVLDTIWEEDFDQIYLPDYVKARSTTMIFPEKLMLLLIHIERVMAKCGKSDNYWPISWTLEGRAILINPEKREELVKEWLPLFFRKGKFESFTRKLYRWGFSQVTGTWRPSKESDKVRTHVFASPCFQKEKRGLIAYMKIITARNSGRINQPILKEAPESDADQDQHKIPQPSGVVSHLTLPVMTGIPIHGTVIPMGPSHVLIIPQGMPLTETLEQYSPHYLCTPKITIIPPVNTGNQHLFSQLMGVSQYAYSYSSLLSGNILKQEGVQHHLASSSLNLQQQQQQQQQQRPFISNIYSPITLPPES